MGTLIQLSCDALKPGEAIEWAVKQGFDCVSRRHGGLGAGGLHCKGAGGVGEADGLDQRQILG